MNVLKKDWDLSQRIMFMLMSGGLGFFMIAALFLGINEEVDSALFSIYQSLFLMVIIYLGGYPVYLIKLMFPKQGTVFTAPNITALLPISKKELLLKKLVPGLVFSAIYLVIASLLLMYYESFNPWSAQMMVPYMWLVLSFALLFDLHFIMGIVTKFSRPSEWLKILGRYSIRQGILISVLVGVSMFVPIVASNIYTIGYVLILGYAVVECIRMLPLLEEIYQ